MGSGTFPFISACASKSHSTDEGIYSSLCRSLPLLVEILIEIVTLVIAFHIAIINTV